MEVIVDNTLRIHNPTQEVLDFCKKELEIDNPQFIKNKQLGFSVYKVPRKLCWYEKRGSDIIVPFGCLNKIYSLYSYPGDYKVVIHEPTKIDYKSNIKLYDYQEDAKNKALKAKNGVIVMSAGSGKTQTALQLVAELGVKTLWLTHTMDLLNQSYARATDNFENVKISKIANGKIDIADNITFATVQTLCKTDLSQYKNEWDCIIVDEAHRIAGTPAQLGMFYKVINSLSARYKFGLTATPQRAVKGTEKALFSLIGDVVCEISKDVIADRIIKAKIQPVLTNFVIPEDAQNFDGTLNYAVLSTVLCEDEKRNDIILKVLEQCKGKSTLVLSDRLSQLGYFQEKLGYGVKIDGSMTSKKARQQREDFIQDMRDGKETLLFSSYQLAKEGLDIPRLERLILASPHKDLATIIQSVGRIERKFEGKATPLCYDIVDSNKYHIDMFNKRKTIYRKNKNEILPI